MTAAGQTGEVLSQQQQQQHLVSFTNTEPLPPSAEHWSSHPGPTPRPRWTVSRTQAQGKRDNRLTGEAR